MSKPQVRFPAPPPDITELSGDASPRTSPAFPECCPKCGRQPCVCGKWKRAEAIEPAVVEPLTGKVTAWREVEDFDAEGYAAAIRRRRDVSRGIERALADVWAS